jgi:hypothetical protein
MYSDRVAASIRDAQYDGSPLLSKFVGMENNDVIMDEMLAAYHIRRVDPTSRYTLPVLQEACLLPPHVRHRRLGREGSNNFVQMLVRNGGRSLDTVWAESPETLTETFLAHMWSDVMGGLALLHSNGLFLSDIHGGNVVVDETAVEAPAFRFIDFSYLQYIPLGALRRNIDKHLHGAVVQDETRCLVLFKKVVEVSGALTPVRKHLLGQRLGRLQRYVSLVRIAPLHADVKYELFSEDNALTVIDVVECVAAINLYQNCAYEVVTDSQFMDMDTGGDDHPRADSDEDDNPGRDTNDTDTDPELDSGESARHSELRGAYHTFLSTLGMPAFAEAMLLARRCLHTRGDSVYGLLVLMPLVLCVPHVDRALVPRYEEYQAARRALVRAHAATLATTKFILPPTVRDSIQLIVAGDLGTRFNRCLDLSVLIHVLERADSVASQKEKAARKKEKKKAKKDFKKRGRGSTRHE